MKLQNLQKIISMIFYVSLSILWLIFRDRKSDIYIASLMLVRAFLFLIQCLLLWFSISKTTIYTLVSPIITISYITIYVISSILNIGIFITVLISMIVIDWEPFPIFLVLFVGFMIISLITDLLIKKLRGVNHNTIDILTYNIQRGHGLDGQFNIIKTSSVLREINADIVCMQEITQDCFDLLADELYPMYPIRLNGTRHKSELAIFSKYQFMETISCVDPCFKDIAEDRGLISAKIQKGDTSLWIITTHWSADALGNKQILSSKKMIDFCAKLRGPVVVCGDFNSVPASAAIDYLRYNNLTDMWSMKLWPWEMGFTAFSGPLSEHKYFKFFLPQYYFRLDYVFGKAINEIFIKVYDNDASDHKPVLARCAFK